MNDRVVCVMSVGAGKYRKQYELVRDNLMAYAKKCHADFRFIDDYIDKDKKRDIYSQKLLIPDYLREYEQVLFLDLDYRFNCMPYFEIGNPYADRLYALHQNRLYGKAEHVLSRLTGEKHMLLLGAHYKLIRRLFDDGAYIVHFAGGYWNTHLYRKCMKHLWR